MSRGWRTSGMGGSWIVATTCRRSASDPERLSGFQIQRLWIACEILSGVGNVQPVDVLRAAEASGRLPAILNTACSTPRSCTGITFSAGRLRLSMQPSRSMSPACCVSLVDRPFRKITARRFTRAKCIRKITGVAATSRRLRRCDFIDV